MTSSWKLITGSGTHGVAIANYRPEQTNELNEEFRTLHLQILVGDVVSLEEECNEWYLGRVISNPGMIGVFPKSFIHTYTETKEDLPIVAEIASTLHEWHQLVRQLYVQQHVGDKETQIKEIQGIMRVVMDLRDSLISNRMTHADAKETQQKVTSKMDLINSRQHLDLVVRDEEGNVLSALRNSAVKMYRQHQTSAKNVNEQLGMVTKQSDGVSISNSFRVNIKVKNFISRNAPPEVDLVISIYEVIDQQSFPKALCESFLVKGWKTRGGGQDDVQNRENLKAVFGDIYKNDIANRKLFLVCGVIQNGNYCDKIVDEKVEKGKSQLKFKKPAGLAAFDISGEFTFRGGKNQEIKTKLIDLPYLRSIDESESLTETFKRLVFSKERGKSADDKVVVEIGVSFGGDAALHVNRHSKCHHYKRNHHGPLLMENSVLHCKKLGLPEIILPNDVRNDLYVNIVHGELKKANFKVGTGGQRPNMEVTMEVCDGSGKALPESLSSGESVACNEEARQSQNLSNSGLEHVYRTCVLYHVGKIEWNEVVKVSVNTEDFSGCHLRFTFRHMGRNDVKERPKPIALAFLKLVNIFDGTAVRDGDHNLCVYKIEKGNTEYENGSYLNLKEYSSTVLQLDKKDLKEIKNEHNLTPLSETFCIKTTLASTKLTQNEGLSSLLKWRAEPRSIQRSLQMFERKIDSDELVKFIPDVLDALFSILMETEEGNKFNNFENFVFKNIVKCISLITEEGGSSDTGSNREYLNMKEAKANAKTSGKHHHFIPVLELYIQENFYHRLAYEKLLDVVKSIAENTTIAPRDSENTMDVLKYIFKFIVRSRLLPREYDEEGTQEQFEERLMEVLDALKAIMFYRANDTQKTQTSCLKNLIASVPDLSTVISKESLSQVLKSMFCALADDQLEAEKMEIIKDLIKSPLFQDKECRIIILPEITKVLKGVLERSQTMTLQRNGSTASSTESRKLLVTCTGTLGDVLDELYKVSEGNQKEDAENPDVSEIMSTCLRTIIQHVANRQPNDPNIPDIVANMISIFQSMSSYHFKQYYLSFEPDDPTGRMNMVDMINEMLAMFTDLITNNVYAKNWNAMIMLQNSVMLKSLKELSCAIQDYLLTPFESHVWKNYFHCAIQFITQESLQVEKFSENKRKQILSNFRDMRKEMGMEVKKMWNSLGKYKSDFIPDMVPSFLEMTLIPETYLRKATIPIFFDMMQCEYYSPNESGEAKQHFDELEDAIISGLDHFITDVGEGDVHYQDLFTKILTSLCEQHTSMKDIGTEFVTKAGRLMELLLEYRRITKEQEDVKENHMSCIKNLLDFYKIVDRKDSYIRYLKKLSGLHEECKNWAEASFTLLEYAKLLEWENTPLDERDLAGDFAHGKGVRTNMELKEMMYNKVINMFNDGQMWENALEMCEELMKVYKEQTFEFEKLASLLKRMSSYYENIMKKHRNENYYYRVGFYGRGFPAFLQNKIFIFRGRIFESLLDFQSRISDQYPNAEMMTKMDPPSEEEKESLSQLLQIIKVDPVVEYKPEFQGRDVHQKILSHYKANQVCKFKYERPYHFPKKNKEVEIASLWIEKTMLQTTEKFPGMLQWFPLCKEPEVIKLCPLEVQVKAMERANLDMRELVLSYLNDPEEQLQPLTMKLNGIIDAAVAGGTSNYDKAFLTDEYLEQNPDHAENLNELKQQLANQIPLLQIALQIHDERKSDAMAPLHERLAEMFKTMKAQVESKYGQGECDLDCKRFSMMSKASDLSSSSTPPIRDSVEDYATLKNPKLSTLNASNGNLGNRYSGMNGSTNDVSLRTKSSNYLNTRDEHQKSTGYTSRVSDYMKIGMKSVGRRKSNVKDKDVSRLNTKFNPSTPTFEEHPSGSRTPNTLSLPSYGGNNTSRPSSGQFMSSTPSRSPSNSNRGSMTSNEGSFYEQSLPQPPPVPPKSLKGSFLGDDDTGSLR